MEFSGLSGYLRLKQMDPGLAQSILRFSEGLTIRHNLHPRVSTDIKQALCQFALDMAVRQATLRTLSEIET